MKRTQHGYYNLDFSGLFVFLICLGIVVGVLVTIGLPWVWEFVKPWLHGITA